VWLPEAEAPAPAILEYIPYRKDDATAPRDAALHGRLAELGFACVRVDLRGSGSSEGVMDGEYLQQELDDGVDAIAWIAAQEWCNGRVGMIGKSWGGFNGLQIAALAPEALRCVVSVCSTDDRYRDDVHYTGGCLFAGAALSWATTMLAYTARPPDPSVVGDGWRAEWQQRLERLRPFGHDWVAHQRRDDFWRHGSVCEDPAAIRCPVYMAGGWADPYRGAVLRMLEAAPDRVRGLIGPWAHVYPHQGAPGPAIDFIELCRRVFAHHLAGDRDGLDDEPRLRAWLQEAVPPKTGYAVRPGRWVGEDAWPPAREPLRLHLGERGLTAEAEPAALLEHVGTLAHGSDGPFWLPWGAEGEAAGDQRAEDGRSLAFDSPPLDTPVELLGEPRLRVTVVPRSTTGQVVARLCDVAPDGRSTLVTFGVLNLCHAQGHDDPRPLVPGEPLTVAVPLTATAYAFPAGHRIRLAVSTCYWPWAWPHPDGLALAVRTGEGSTLELPAREPQPRDDALSPLDAPPELFASGGVEQLGPAGVHRTVRRDATTGRIDAETQMSYFGSLRLTDGLAYGEEGCDRFGVVGDDPLSAEASSSWRIEISRGDWSTIVVAESSLRCDETDFILADRVEAHHGNELLFARDWHARIPRDFC
jgi:putative CocE/NonD family hydrolase